MTRDMQLVKAILKYVERNGRFRGRPIELPEFPGYSPESVEYHATLCVQAGYLKVEETNGGIFPRYLTWAGQEALAELRCQT